MKIGDLVEVCFSNGDVQVGKIARLDQRTVTVRMTDDPNAGAITVPVRRLKPKGKDRWRLDL